MTPFKGSIFIVICLTLHQPILANLLVVNDTVKINDTNAVTNTDLNHAEKKKKPKPRKYKKGDTIYYCEVLKLSSHNYKEHTFAVFGYAHILARKGRSKMKINYILKRERNYLSKIFYTKAILLERKRVDTSVQEHMKLLEKKFPFVKMWGVLDANAMVKSEAVSL